MVLRSTQYNFCLLLNQNRKVTVLVLGLMHRGAGDLMHWLYAPCADPVPLRTTSVEVNGTHAI